MVRAVALLTFFSILLPVNEIAAAPQETASRQEQRTRYPPSVTDPTLLQPGATLVSITGEERVILLNEKGVVHHSWPVDATRAVLLKSCNLLVVHGTDWGKRKPRWKKLRKTIREYSWNGEVVWEYEAPSIAHHDIRRDAAGVTYFPVLKVLRLPVPLPGGDVEERRIRSDWILGVSREGEQLVKWQLENHLDTLACGSRKCATPPHHDRWKKRVRDWSHVNTVFPLPPNRHSRLKNNIFKEGHLLVLPRNFWQVLLFDPASQEVVWDYHGPEGDPLMAPHESIMIDRNLPGGGNILIFDNGHKRKRPYTLIRELDPTLDRIVWQYGGPGKFFVEAKGAAHRLPNGNTLISTGARGFIREVTPQGEVAWEVEFKNSINRAKKYAWGFCHKLRSLKGEKKKELDTL